MNTIEIKSRKLNITLLVLRVGIGLLMLGHGIPKLQMLISGDIQFPGVMGMSPTLSLALAVFSEVICSILLLVGLRTRYAAIPLILTMLAAVLVIHGGDPFAKQELGILYLIVYLALFMLGSGKFSFDAVLRSYRIDK
ncbi:DoxX family protein [Aquaticitalea lipolytica]|uniref:DoxX family protein n=1 Tax=Aquaticitalea lipolytica TaxID=1247562 RepID=UPI0024BA6B45|nr:DoxX family protein [Aquaticitalea lipolytica]